MTFTISGDVATLLGGDHSDGDPVALFIECSQPIMTVDSEGRLGGRVRVTVATDGTFSVADLPESVSDIPLYRLVIDSRSLRMAGNRKGLTTGWFPLTADRDLTWIIANYVSVTMITAQVAADIAAAVALGATNDTATASFVNDTGSATYAAASAKLVAVLDAEFDGTDETATLQAAVTAGGTLIIPRGKTIKSGKITVPATGITIRGEGKTSVIDYIDDGTAGATLLEALDGANLTVENLSILSTNAASRTSLYGHIRTRGWTGLYVRRVWFGKSPSCAIWTSTTTNFELTELDIEDTYADGLHISRGSKHGTIAHIKGRDLADDLIGINSYIDDGGPAYDQCEDITVTDIKGQNIGTGRGVAVNGGKDIAIDGVTIDGVDQAAVLVSQVTGDTYTPENVTVDNVTAHDTGRDVPVGGTSGAVYVAHLDGGHIGRVSGDIITVEATARVTRADRPTGNELAAGQETMNRFLATGEATMSSGVLRLTYFTATRTETLSNAVIYSATTPAGATPTLVRVGLYERESNGDLTLVASTANDTALLASGNTEYVKALSAAYEVKAGQRYALGIIVVTGATAPTVLALASTSTRPNVALLARTPRLTGVRTGQTDLPTTITTGVLANTTSAPYVALL